MPAQKILKRYPKDFGKWVVHLEHLLLLQLGGYQLKNNDLSLTEWKALALLEKIQSTRPMRDELKRFDRRMN